MDRHERVAVVGGSLVGPATELLLRQAGFKNVTTFEGSPIVNPTSGGVMGLRDETLDLLKLAGVDVTGLRGLRSNVVHSYDVVDGQITSRGSVDFPGLTTTWEQLHEALVMPVDVQHGKRVKDLVIKDPGPVWLKFTDGDEQPFDLVIFADGRRSRGRAIMDPDRTLRYQGYGTWRGLADPQRDVDGFSRHYDVEHGWLFSLTEPTLTTDRSYWEFNVNMSRDLITRVLGGPPETRTFLLPHQVGLVQRDVLHQLGDEGWLPGRFQDLIRSSEEIMLLPVNDLNLPDRAQWDVAGSKVVLVGDALIPARLQVGAGLNMGIKQAAGMVRYLASGQDLAGWEREVIEEIAPWIELGRSRAHRSNLGTYRPVRPGKTAVPADSRPWSTPRWVAA